MTRFAALLLLLVATNGCYSYGSVGVGDIRSGQRVRLTLSDSGTTALAAALGPSTAAVTGLLMESAADAYVVAVRQTLTRGGREADWDGEQVSIPRALVVRIEGRRFSRGRTALAGTALVAAVMAARGAFWGPGGVFGGGGPSGGGPGPR